MKHVEPGALRRRVRHAPQSALSTLALLPVAAMIALCTTLPTASAGSPAWTAQSARDVETAAARFQPQLTSTSDPFAVGTLSSSSLQAWSGSRSPVLRLSVENPLPLAFSYTLATAGGASLSVVHADAYEHVGIVGPGQTLNLDGILVAPDSHAVITLSLTSDRAVWLNIFGRTIASLSGYTTDDVNQLMLDLRSGPGSALLGIFRQAIKEWDRPGAVKVKVVSYVSTALVKFGANRANRTWLLNRLGKNLFAALRLGEFSAEVGRTIGAYFGLAHDGTSGTQTLTLSVVPTTTGGLRLMPN